MKRVLAVHATLERGFVELHVYRGVVTVQERFDGGSSTSSFSGPGRYLAAQRALRELRREALREVEANRQLVRIAG